MKTELLKGVFDMHIHSFPDVAPRKDNDIGLAKPGDPWPWSKEGRGISIFDETGKLRPEVRYILEIMIDCGIDGIIVDRPDILRGILAARGYNLPKGFSIAEEVP